MSDDLKLFAGGAILTALTLVLSIWVKDFIPAAVAWGGALIGAAAMKMKGNN